MNCLNCNREVPQIVGRRARLYCDGKCKGEYWRGGRTKEKRKTILVSEYKELVRLAKLGKMVEAGKYIPVVKGDVKDIQINVVRQEGESVLDFKIRQAEEDNLLDLLS